MKVGYSVVSTHNTTQVLLNNTTQQKALFATTNFECGSVIAKFEAKEILQQPNYLTVQIDVDKHILLNEQYLQYTNHSCNPNVFFNTTTFELIAIQNITAEDELCFFYPSSEWEMQQPFTCNCGYVNCLQYIQGAKYLTTQQLEKYQLTDFIKHMLATQNK